MNARWISLATGLLLTLPAAAQRSGVFATWAEPTGAVLEVFPCGNEACLRLLRLPPDAPAYKDSNNPDASLRSRPMCGLVIGTGFQLHGDMADGGAIYDPKSGKTYRGSMKRDGASLNLRGYVGLKMFGRSERWTQFTGPVPPCSAP